MTRDCAVQDDRPVRYNAFSERYEFLDDDGADRALQSLLQLPVDIRLSVVLAICSGCGHPIVPYKEECTGCQSLEAER